MATAQRRDDDDHRQPKHEQSIHVRLILVLIFVVPVSIFCGKRGCDDIQKDEAPPPRCAACDVPMWLIRVQRHPLDPAKDKAIE